MKKKVKNFILVLITILSLTLLVACGGGGSTTDSEKPDGGAVVDQDEVYNGPNTDPKKAKATLEKNGYEVELIDNEEAFAYMTIKFELEDGDLKAYLEAYNYETGDFINMFYCKNESVANALWDNDIVKAEREDLDDGQIYQKFGSIICFGTEQAVKDAR